MSELRKEIMTPLFPERDEVNFSMLEKNLMIALKTGGKSRDELVDITGAPRTTIYDALKRLINHGLVRKCKEFKAKRKRGRPRVIFSMA